MDRTTALYTTTLVPRRTLGDCNTRGHSSCSPQTPQDPDQVYQVRMQPPGPQQPKVPPLAPCQRPFAGQQMQCGRLPGVRVPAPLRGALGTGQTAMLGPPFAKACSLCFTPMHWPSDMCRRPAADDQQMNSLEAAECSALWSAQSCMACRAGLMQHAPLPVHMQPPSNPSPGFDPSPFAHGL